MPPPAHKRSGQPGHAEDLRDASRGERLQRVLADAGVGSRRACEQMIEDGRVTVNGELVTALPVWADPARDRIEVDGRPIAKTPDKHVYVLLNKPARVLTSAADEPGADRRTVVDLVDHPSGARLFPVGRLDYDTVGLVIMTNDGELANRLTHPRYGVPKRYRAKVAGAIDEDAARELERGIYLAERKAGRTEGAARTAHVELEVVRRERSATWLDITLREGRNRQVRRMLAAVGLPVKSLERTGMGPLKLKGVARGGWRDLTLAEVGALRKAAGKPRGAGEGGLGKSGSGQGSSGQGQGGRRSAKSGSKPGSVRPKKGSGGPADPAPAAPVRRRTMKNAINRAGRTERDDTD